MFSFVYISLIKCIDSADHIIITEYTLDKSCIDRISIKIDCKTTIFIIRPLLCPLYNDNKIIHA